MIPKMIPNPAWVESEDARLQKQLTIEDMIGRGEVPEDAFPEEYGKAIPESGGWIILLVSVMVGREVAEGITKSILVPHLSMWYAMPHVSTARVAMHPMGAKPRAKDREWIHLKQAIINTPDGPVHIWPREYRKIDITKFLEFSDDEGLRIHYLSDQAHVDEGSLFYLRSRGIGKGAAQRMLLGTITNSNYCYFTFAPEVTRAIGEGVGMPYLTHVNHQRRAASMALRKAQQSGGTQC